MKVLIVVDMQQDFVSGALGTPEAQALVPRAAARTAAAAERGETVLFTRDTHGPDYLDTQEGRKLPVPHCIRDSVGWEIVPQLAGYARTVFDKPAFGSPDLAQALLEQDRALRSQGLPGVEKVTLIGLCTDICVISNAMLIKAFLPECAVAVDAGCCAGVTPESHETALRAMETCQITIEGRAEA